MAAIKRLLTLDFIPATADFALFIIRVGTGMTLFLRHGLEKLTHFSQMAHHFSDPLHIGPLPSFLFALLSDSICSILIVLGLFTRWSALIVFVNIFVAWSLVHHFLFFGRAADHGELIVLYLVVSLGLLFSGAGRYSIDQSIASPAPASRRTVKSGR